MSKCDAEVEANWSTIGHTVSQQRTHGQLPRVQVPEGPYDVGPMRFGLVSILPVTIDELRAIADTISDDVKREEFQKSGYSCWPDDGYAELPSFWFE